MSDPTGRKPRGDFQCISCGEVYELPLGAACCPDTACSGLLERRFTPPMITTQVNRETVKLAEATVAQLPPKPKFQLAENQRTVSGIPAAAALGAVMPGGRGVSMPVLGGIMGKNPKPIIQARG